MLTGRRPRACAAASWRSTSRASTRTTSPRARPDGIAIRAGHHCAMPLHERLGVPATARASFGVYTTKAEIDALAAGLQQVVKLFGVEG